MNVKPKWDGKKWTLKTEKQNKALYEIHQALEI